MFYQLMQPCVPEMKEKCLLTDDIYDYIYVSQGKTTVASIDDNEELEYTHDAFSVIGVLEWPDEGSPKAYYRAASTHFAIDPARSTSTTPPYYLTHSHILDNLKLSFSTANLPSQIHTNHI